MLPTFYKPQRPNKKKYHRNKQRKLGSSIARFGSNSTACFAINLDPLPLRRVALGQLNNTTFQSNARTTLLEFFEMKCEDKLHTRIRDVGLFAADVKFHTNCRRKYMIRCSELSWLPV